MLPAEYLDPQTPAEVDVAHRRAAPMEDPTLGEPLGAAGPDVPAVPASPAHGLVALGDSLTHGMTSGAVFRTSLSWPAIAARCLGVELTVPSYGGPLGGLPLNVEGLLHRLQDKLGDRLGVVDVLQLPVLLHALADDNEEFWEGGGVGPALVRHHNVGVYGLDVRDALDYTAGVAARRLLDDPPHDDLLGAIPDHDTDIAVRSVLGAFGDDAAQVDAAAWHGAHGGIETLVVALGANNALRSVVDKSVRWSGEGYDRLVAKDAYTVWRPSHFAAEYARLVARISTIPARRVVLATVPHVTVAPIATGINPLRPGRKWRPGSRYFPVYVDPWIDEESFRPTRHRHLTHQQARAVDSAVDQYNATIADAVRTARRQGRDWYLLDLCGLLDSLARRRFADDPDSARRNGVAPRALPEPLADLDTRFFRSDRTGRLQGGLFGLDGVHPTTCGYGLVADAFLDVLRGAGRAADPVDFAALRAADTLNTDPPALMTSALELLSPILTRLMSRR